MGIEQKMLYRAFLKFKARIFIDANSNRGWIKVLSYHGYSSSYCLDRRFEAEAFLLDYGQFKPDDEE